MAGGRSAILSVRIVSDAQDAQKGMSDASTGVEKFTSAVGKAAVPAAIAGAAIVAFGKQAADAASSQQQAFGGVEAVYGAAADSVLAYTSTSAQALGLSKADYANFAAGLGAQFKSLGQTTDEAAGNSNKLISMGADLAATFGGTTTDAVTALASAMRGEFDPAEKYGLALSAASVNAELAARGLDKLEGQALATAKSQVVLDLMTKQSAGAIGQFARESDTAAGSAQIANAQWKDAQAVLGAQLLPIMAAVTAKLAELATWVAENSTLVTVFVGIIGGLALAVLAVAAALKVYAAGQAVVTGATNLWAAAQWLLNTAILASPITWIVIAVIALVAVIVLIATKTTWFQDIWEAAWAVIKSAALAVWNWITSTWTKIGDVLAGPIKAAVDFIERGFADVVGAAQAAWNWVARNWPLILAILTGPIGLAVLFITTHLDEIIGAAQAVWNYLSGAFTSIWATIRSTAGAALDAILDPIHKIETAFNRVVDAIKSVLDWIGKIHVPDLSALNPFKSAPAPAAAYYTAPGAPAYASVVPRGPAGPAAAAAAGTGPTIVIQGALDPVAVARQVRRMLRDDDRRRRGVTIGATA